MGEEDSDQIWGPLHDDCAHRPPPASGDQLEMMLAEGGGGSEHGTRHRWARLLAQVYLGDLEHCPKCQGIVRWAEVVKTPSAAARLMARMGLAPDLGRAGYVP